MIALYMVIITHFNGIYIIHYIIYDVDVQLHDITLLYDHGGLLKVWTLTQLLVWLY